MMDDGVRCCWSNTVSPVAWSFGLSFGKYYQILVSFVVIIIITFISVVFLLSVPMCVCVRVCTLMCVCMCVTTYCTSREVALHSKNLISYQWILNFQPLLMVCTPLGLACTSGCPQLCSWRNATSSRPSAHFPCLTSTYTFLFCSIFRFQWSVLC